MRVIFIPNYSHENPYQQNLAESLSKKGVQIILENLTWALLFFKVLFKYKKPEIIHIHWQHDYLVSKKALFSFLKSFLFILEMVILRFLGVKIVWTVHNIVNHEKKDFKIELFFSSFLSKISNKIIVHNPQSQKEIIEAYKIRKIEKCSVIAQGNFIDNYENIITNKEARIELNINEDNFLFLFFGLIRPYKGLNKLIESFQSKNFQEAKLLIVGRAIDKKYEAEIRSLCDTIDNIEFQSGFVPENKIQVYMNAADIVVIPYIEILNSAALLLAMSFKKPIIAPKTGFFTSVLDENGGFLYNSNENIGLSTAMELALNSDISRMGNYNYELAKKFDWDSVAEKTYKIYSECLNR